MGYLRPIPPQNTYFTVSESQFIALLQSYDLVELNFTDLVERRGGLGWDGNPATSGQAVKDWLQQKIVDSWMPQAYRGAFLIALWATYEATIKMVSDTLRRFDPSLPHFTSPRGNWLPSVETYFARHLRYSLFPKEVRGIKNEVEALQRIRHVFAHANGLKQATVGRQWKLLVPYAERRAGIKLDRGFIDMTPEFVRGRFLMMAPAIAHVVDKGREKLASNPAFIDFEIGQWRR